jgi:glycosyltransferase involved in cell wall biosynthesis
MEAFPLVREALGPGVALVLAGDGPWMKKLKAAAPEGVHFLGYRTGRALAETYAAGDLFVFPSDTETFGNVVVEALASGLPVIAAQKGGVVDSVLPGKTGELAPPGDPGELARAVIRVLSDENYRRSLSLQARAFAGARTWPGVLDRLLSDYRDALGGGTVPDSAATGTRSGASPPI